MTVIFIRLECQFVIISTLLANSSFPEIFIKSKVNRVKTVNLYKQTGQVLAVNE